MRARSAGTSGRARDRLATLIRTFVEDYYERLEEYFIFPEFERQKKLVGLITVLHQQHEAGRKVTDIILRNAAGDQFRREDARKEVVRSCEGFIRMYPPHEALEDTVLFPTLHKIVPAKKLEELGEKSEEAEDRLFGIGEVDEQASGDARRWVTSEVLALL